MRRAKTIEIHYIHYIGAGLKRSAQQRRIASQTNARRGTAARAGEEATSGDS